VFGARRTTAYATYPARPTALITRPHRAKLPSNTERMPMIWPGSFLWTEAMQTQQRPLFNTKQGTALHGSAPEGSDSRMDLEFSITSSRS
jgi:hypothetical protein